MISHDRTQAQWAAGTAAGTFDQALRRHMLRVYNVMMLGLALTGGIAALVAATPALYGPIFGTPLKWVVMLAPLAFVAVLSWRFEQLSATGLQALFWAFCGVMGLSMASVFLVFSPVKITTPRTDTTNWIMLEPRNRLTRPATTMPIRPIIRNDPSFDRSVRVV